MGGWLILALFVMVIFVSMLYFGFGEKKAIIAGSEKRKIQFETKRTERLFDKETGEIVGERQAKA